MNKFIRHIEKCSSSVGPRNIDLNPYLKKHFKEYRIALEQTAFNGVKFVCAEEIFTIRSFLVARPILLEMDVSFVTKPAQFSIKSLLLVLTIPSCNTGKFGKTLSTMRQPRQYRCCARSDDIDWEILESVSSRFYEST